MLKETWNASANTAVPPDGFGRKVTMLWQRTLFQSPCGVRGEPECHHKNPRCLRRGVVSLMLTVSTKTRNIYQGILVGLATGTVVGLIAGLFTPAQIFSNDAANNAAVGFLVDGINNILPTCVLVISIFGIMGVLSDAGMLDLIAEKILNSKMAGSKKGAELICMIGISVTTILLGGVTSASILTFGPILNKIGTAKNIHPYRRANLLDGTANSLPSIIPFMSVFVFIRSALTGLSPVVVAGGTIYAFVLFLVFLVAVLTGWGCQKEE